MAVSINWGVLVAVVLGGYMRQVYGGIQKDRGRREARVNKVSKTRQRLYICIHKVV